MMRVLVDTSVWVRHFPQHDEALTELLGLDRVAIPPMVFGELACGTLPSRSGTLAEIGRLDSTLLTKGSALWTLDRRLAELAERFGVLHHSSVVR
ncbi:MAG: PIN domain-containing protein [Variovorax sp.]|nr:MAG: PIN domain-containing protein [Variovorax sp.]